EFRQEGLRNHCSDIVKEFRSGKDVFTGATIHGLKGYHLDHVVELHIVRDNFDLLKRTGTGFDQQKTKLQEDLKRIVNERENLNFTTADINYVKFEGFHDFQAAYQQRQFTVSSRLDNGIVDFLCDAKTEKTGKRLSRAESRKIQKAVYDAKERIVHELQDENRVSAQMIELLQDNFVAMKLK
ncbi:MAG: hypothetical protein SGILL_008968, partial [Bacillariaceae sp.]